ncbi:unnamed protein product, partial [Porites evermanni]
KWIGRNVSFSLSNSNTSSQDRCKESGKTVTVHWIRHGSANFSRCYEWAITEESSENESKSCRKKFFTEAFRDMTQQQGSGKVYKRKRKANSVNRSWEEYTLINNALHSIIKQFTIKINETLVTEQSDTQAYNAYIKTLLNFTDQAKKSYLTKALYYKDTAGHMDEVDNTADRNLG